MVMLLKYKLMNTIILGTALGRKMVIVLSAMELWWTRSAGKLDIGQVVYLRNGVVEQGWSYGPNGNNRFGDDFLVE